MKQYVLFGMLFMTFQTHSQNAVKITFLPKFEDTLEENPPSYIQNTRLPINLAVL